jgi:predicted nucleic acid-binding protein
MAWIPSTSAKRSWSTTSRAREAICDTSPIQYPHQIGCLHLLADFYERVLVPPAVIAELQLKIQAPERLDQSPVASNLGAGEREVLALGR